mmetsp:Transcript_6317/g.18178  ORF Transcript_6317/g.18178 Transcript_6317/m.18178 type:complete len:90 (-) Transcript_6317:475-744(-)
MPTSLIHSPLGQHGPKHHTRRLAKTDIRRRLRRRSLQPDSRQPSMRCVCQISLPLLPPFRWTRALMADAGSADEPLLVSSRQVSKRVKL